MSRAPAGPLELDAFLPYRLSVLTNMVSRTLAGHYSQSFGLTIAQWRVMAVLGQTPGLSAEQVSQATEMDKVTVSRAVARLRAAGRLERDTDRADRRRSVLRLSPEGHAIYERIAPAARRFEAALLECLSPSEAAGLDRILTKLTRRARALGTGTGDGDGVFEVTTTEANPWPRQ